MIAFYQWQNIESDISRLQGSPAYIMAYIMHTTFTFTLFQPEPITGSSRMKGGTATKIILESIFLSAVHPNRKTLQDQR